MGLSDHCNEVRQKYTECILKTSRSERHVCRDRFCSDDSVLKLLASSKLSDRLHPAIVQVMDDLKEDWRPEEVAAAFDAMETYAVNLLEYPWKKEFHTILLYSGFYKTQLEPNLQEPHLLLRIIGYEHVPDDRLFLVDGVPSTAVLTNAAVDFFLAATECRVIASIVSKVEHSTPVEVYWVRRANAGDEQMCIDTLTLSRRPLPPDCSDKPPSTDVREVDRHSTRFGTDVQKRGDSPYDNILSTTDELNPHYGFLTQPYSTQSSYIQPSRTDGLQPDTQQATHFLPSFSTTLLQPNVTGQAVKSPIANVGSIFQRGSPEAPPPVYAAAKDMPSAQLQNISYGRDDEVDALAALLKKVDPHVMENAAHRQQIMSQLENYSSSGSFSTKPDLSPEVSGRPVQTSLASAARTGWQCEKCTYYNENTCRVCDMCQNEQI